MRPIGSSKNLIVGLSAVLLGMSSHALGQEVAFADYAQPRRDFSTYFNNFDTTTMQGTTFGAYGGTSATSTSSGYAGNGISVTSWPSNGGGTNGQDGVMMSNVLSPDGRDVLAYDIQVMYKATAGAPSKFRIDLNYIDGNGTNITSVGTSTNGGIVDLAASGSWLRLRCRRAQDLVNGSGAYLRASRIRIVTIRDSGGNFPGLDASYNTSSPIIFDNFKVTTPCRLSGFYKVTGTTNKDLGVVTFPNTGIASDGSGLGTFTDWIQNLGNVDIVNVFGPTDFGGSGTRNSSNMLYTYLDGSGNRQFNADRFTTALTGLLNNTWIGGGAMGSASTDKFFGFSTDASSPFNSYVFRQVGTSTLTHSIRVLNTGAGYSGEISISLGGEAIVGLADVNCDGALDFVTRSSGNNYNLRLSQGNTGSFPSQTLSIGSSSTLSTYGYLSCLAVGDINGDGFDDLLVTDLVSHDVFSLICTPSGGSLTWLFTLDTSTQEKVWALTDADGDGLPEIYSTRQRTTDSVGEINIRKLNSAGTSVTTFGLMAEYDYTHYVPFAVGDINGDGSGDVAMKKNNSPNYSVITFLVDPSTRYILGTGPHFVCWAGTDFVRPIYYHGLN